MCCDWLSGVCVALRFRTNIVNRDIFSRLVHDNTVIGNISEIVVTVAYSSLLIKKFGNYIISLLYLIPFMIVTMRCPVFSKPIIRVLCRITWLATHSDSENGTYRVRLNLVYRACSFHFRVVNLWSLKKSISRIRPIPLKWVDWTFVSGQPLEQFVTSRRWCTVNQVSSIAPFFRGPQSQSFRSLFVRQVSCRSGQSRVNRCWTRSSKVVSFI